MTAKDGARWANADDNRAKAESFLPNDGGQSVIARGQSGIDEEKSAIDAALSDNDEEKSGIDAAFFLIDDGSSVIDAGQSVIDAVPSVIDAASSVIDAAFTAIVPSRNGSFRQNGAAARIDDAIVPWKAIATRRAAPPSLPGESANTAKMVR